MVKLFKAESGSNWVRLVLLLLTVTLERERLFATRFVHSLIHEKNSGTRGTLDLFSRKFLCYVTPCDLELAWTPPTYRFTGKPVSQTTGLYYYYHRWYDPSIGRFISQDPKPCPLSECQRLNRYVYVTNRPTTLTDPDGEGTIMRQTLDGIISPCGNLRDNSGNLPSGTKILGSGAQPTMSSAGPGTTTMPDPSSEITAPTGILRDNFGNLPAGTQISVVRTPTGSVVMGTSTVANVNRQIDEDRARLVTGGPSIAAFEQYQQCVQTATQLVLTGGVLVTIDGPISLIGAALIEIPPAAAVAEGIALGFFVVGISLVLAGALYYGVNCHYPS